MIHSKKFHKVSVPRDVTEDRDRVPWNPPEDEKKELLISLIENEECIWNPAFVSEEGRKLIEMKVEAWERIKNCYSSTFGQITVDELKSTWKNLQNANSKSKRKHRIRGGHSVEPYTPYKFARSLAFLEKKTANYPSVPCSSSEDSLHILEQLRTPKDELMESRMSSTPSLQGTSTWMQPFESQSAYGEMVDGDMEQSTFRQMTVDANLPEARFIFIGGGNMATALIEGSVKTGFVHKDEVVISARSQATVDKWKSRGYENIFTDNGAMLRKFGGIVVLAVKPQVRFDLYKQLTDVSSISLIVSLMAGVDLLRLESELSQHASYKGPICRLLPNTPCSVGRGTSILSVDDKTTHKMAKIVHSFAESVGICVPSDEKSFNAAGVVAGCGPAFTFLVIEALSDGGVLSGMNRTDAMKVAAHTVMGAAQMVFESGEHPGVLKDKVCSPAGTTIAGVRELEKAAVRSAFMEAVKAGTDRANSM